MTLLATVTQLKRVLWPEKAPDDPMFTAELEADLGDAVQIGSDEVIRYCERDFAEVDLSDNADPPPLPTTWIFDAPVGPILMIPDAARIVAVRAYGILLLSEVNYQAIYGRAPATATIQQLRRIWPVSRAAMPWTYGYAPAAYDPHAQVEVTVLAGWPAGTVPLAANKATLVVAARWYDLQETKFQNLAGNDALGTRRPPSGLIPGPVEELLTPWVRVGVVPVVEG